MPGRKLYHHTRKRQILDGAMLAAHTKDYRQITQKDIAALAGVSTGLITFHFDNMDGLRNKLMEYAVETSDLKIVAQGIVAQDPIALGASDTLRANALATLSNA